MTLPLPEFIGRLTASGLLSAAEIDAVVAALPAEQQPADGPHLADALVRAGKLTRFQADRLLQDRGRGLVLGQYVVLERLGEGGMGEVFKARHRRMDRLVALKVLAAAATNSPDAVQRFHREVKAAARLAHPNIVVAHDADEADGVHFLVMELVEGPDLGTLAKARGRLPVGEAVGYVIQAARGLAYAHDQGVVHRDIKPSNLLVDRHGTVKILDMGLARLEAGVGAASDADRDVLTHTGQIMGTVDYMPPEQAEDTRRADHRSDIYSLGCTLYRLLAGRAPYDGDTVMLKLLAHREQPVPALAAVRPDVPAALDAVVRRMLAKKPAERFATMRDVIAALEPFAAGPDAAVTSVLTPRPAEDDDRTAQYEPSAARPEPSWQTLPAARALHRRPRWLVWLAVGVAVVLPLAAVLWLFFAQGSGAKTIRVEQSRPASAPPALNLLELVRSQVTHRRDWHFRGELLIGQGRDGPAGMLPGNWAILPIPLSPPKEYVLEATVERTAGRSALLIGLVKGDTQFSLMLDAMNQGWTGLRVVDGLPPGPVPPEATYPKPLLLNDRPTAIRCEVRDGGVLVFADDQPILDYRGGYQRLSLSPGIRLPSRHCLFLGVVQSTYRIHTLRLTPITGLSEDLFFLQQ